MDRASGARFDSSRWIRPSRKAEDHVDVAIQMGDLELARRCLEKRRPGLRDGGSAGLSDLAVGLLLEAEPDLAGAIAHFETAVTFMDEHGWVQPHCQALAGLGRARIGLGELESGLEALRRARDIAISLRAAPMLARIDAAITAASEVRFTAAYLVRA